MTGIDKIIEEMNTIEETKDNLATLHDQETRHINICSKSPLPLTGDVSTG